MAKDFNRHFSTYYIQVANKYVKRCSTFQIISKRQIKTTVRYNLTPTSMATVEKGRRVLAVFQPPFSHIRWVSGPE